MENSIEEDIETIKYNMKIIKNVMNNFEDELCENMQMKTDEVNKAIEHILSDYKRVLKENEILKEEKEQAWEEWNNLEQGSYETEQKIKQQIKKLQKENEEVKRLIAHKNEYTKKLEEDLFENAENYVISKQKVKDKIRKNEEIIDISNDGDLIHELYQKNKVYEELLESEE